MTTSLQQAPVSNQDTRPDHICQKHWDEWISSGVKPEIISRNVRTIYDAREVDRLLNRNTKRRTKHSEELVPCWSVNGQDPLGWERIEDGVQIKPDTPPVNEKGKPQKYLGATGYDCAPLFLETEDPEYWEKVLNDVSIPLFGTEGGKKAGAGLSISLATVSIPGVSTCRKLGRLHRNLEIFCKFGRSFYLCFDNDAMEKKPVQEALLAMGREVSAKGAKVMVVMLPPGEAKGMDDFISIHGEEEFKKLVENALTIEEWRSRLSKSREREKLSRDDSKPKSQKYPPADIFATELAEQYKDKFLYNNEHKTWMVYGFKSLGIWQAVDDIAIECQIQSILESRGIIGYGTDSYIQNILKFWRRKSIVFDWNERENILPFSDGIHDISTGIFEEHSPENRLTWCLPRKYNIAEISDWGIIRDWLKEATVGNDKDFNTLTHFAAAVLRGRYDLQKFLYLWGDGGSGKGTYTRLLQAVVGARNSWSGKVESLDDLNQAARLVNKKLAIFPDQDKVFGKLQTFKNLTGGDDISAKLLYKEPFNFFFKGLALMTANSPSLQGGGVGRWFQRRAIIVALNHTPTKVRNLDVEFAPEIAAFTKYLLSITDSQIDEVLKEDKGSEQTDPNFWAMAIRQDSLASWVDQHIIFDANAISRIGSNKNEWSGDEYDPRNSTLFGSYHRYCSQGNLQGKGINNFSPELEEILRKVLKHPEVRKGKDKRGAFFVGIRLRTAMDDVGDDLGDNRVTTLETTSNPCSDSCDDLFTQKSIEENEVSEKQENSNNENPGATIEVPVTAGISSRHQDNSKGFGAVVTAESELKSNPVTTVTTPPVTTEPQNNIEEKAQQLRRALDDGQDGEVIDLLIFDCSLGERSQIEKLLSENHKERLRDLIGT
jgi:putative DNA primase/helicase